MRLQLALSLGLGAHRKVGAKDPGDLRIETGTSVEFDPTSEFELRGIVSQ